MAEMKPKESQNVEYKSSWHDEYLKWICGFANAQGAVMYFGVNNDHEVIGLENVDRKIGRFGKDEADLMFQDVIEGNIIQMADRVMEALQSKYLVSPVRFEGMQRYETLEIPKEAMREILYNAIAHKDYTGPDIQMHIYDDHIEVWNEGELPSGYDEKVLYGKHSSKPRNRNIAGTMFKAGFIDTWGRGFKKIREGFEKAGLPMPKVENFCGGVQVTIERTKFLQMANVTSRVVSNVGCLSVSQLTERHKIIANLIKENPFVSAQDMSVVLSVAKRTIERDLATMQKKGVLIREGNTSARHWVLLVEET